MGPRRDLGKNPTLCGEDSVHQKGHRLSLQHHKIKEENIRLIKGKLRLTAGESLDRFKCTT